MQARRNHQSATRYWPNYRQMAVDVLRLARQATSKFERERYMLATAFFVKRVLEIERSMRQDDSDGPTIEAILSEQQPCIEEWPAGLRRAS